MTHSIEFISPSVRETLRIGHMIAEALRPGDVIALVGPLGAGKTHLVKGMATGLGVADERVVNSPTFVLQNDYAGRLPVHHLDAYRLCDSSQLAAIGFDELCGGDAIVVIEWADRVADAIPDNALWIEIRYVGDSDRQLVLTTNSTAVSERIRSALDRVTKAGDKPE